MALSMTRKQADLLSYIRLYMSETGISPSFDEMKEAMDLKSKSGIHRLLVALEERGLIRRLPNRARCIELMRKSNKVRAPLRLATTDALIDEIEHRGFTVIPAGTPTLADRAIRLSAGGAEFFGSGTPGSPRQHSHTDAGNKFKTAHDKPLTS